MSRYIDADKLKEKLDSFISMNETYTDYNCGYNDCLTAVQDTLANIPTADVAEIVLCKDCKYFLEKQIENHQGLCMCEEKETSYDSDFYPYADGFCSYGERKNGE